MIEDYHDDPFEIYTGPPPLSREQQFLVDRITKLAAIAGEAVAVLAPTITPEIARVEQTLADLFLRANSLFRWRDYERAHKVVDEIDAALHELKQLGLAQGHNRLYFQRMLQS